MAPDDPWLLLADVTLTALHVAVVAGFVFLWMPRSTARIHRWLVVLTALSWLGLGLVYGIGYCFLTDWHWSVKRARGVQDLPGSFLKYAADWITGDDIPPGLVDTVAGLVFAGGCLAAAGRYWQSRRASDPGSARLPMDASSDPPPD